MKNIAFYSALILLAIGVGSCGHQKDYEKPILTSSGCQKIIGFQDARDSKALIPFFVDDDYQLRVQATLAFGSVGDTAALNSLYTMLEEEEPIAQAAAFAIGQIGDTRSVEVLKRILERSMLPETRYEIFDAMGKCGEIDLNYYLASSYNVGKDAKGTAWALMELANRKKLNPAGLELAITILENENDYEVRLAAAHGIARSGLYVSWQKIKEFVLIENIQDVKIALVTGLKLIPTSAIDQELIDNLKMSFYLTQINALRSFQGKENQLINKWVDTILKGDANINLKITTAEYLTSIAGKSESYLSNNNSKDLNWRVRTVLYQEAIINNHKALIAEASDQYKSTSNLYEKGMLLEALGQLPGKKEWLIKEITENDSIVSTYGMEGLVSLINESERKGIYAPYLYETLRFEGFI